MTCDPDEVKEINVTMHVVMATLGDECMKLAATQTKTEMPEVTFPLLTALHDCRPSPVCTTRWLDCAPDMNVTVVCKYVTVNIKRCDHSLAYPRTFNNLEVRKSLATHLKKGFFCPIRIVSCCLFCLLKCKSGY